MKFTAKSPQPTNSLLSYSITPLCCRSPLLIHTSLPFPLVLPFCLPLSVHHIISPPTSRTTKYSAHTMRPLLGAWLFCFLFLPLFLAHIPTPLLLHLIFHRHRLRGSKVCGLPILQKFPFIKSEFDANRYSCFSYMFSVFCFLV